VVAELPHSGAKVTLCTQHVFGPDDRLTEGRGTLPDVPVTWSAADLRVGRDPDLERAWTLLRERGLRTD
jgi:C-terminal processing protease CtpA/Prc